MFGRFLEYALVTPAPLAAWSQWQQLGFAEARTREVWPHAYGVAAMRGLAIGLHGAGDEPRALCFVRPDVAALHRELTGLGLDIEQPRLGSDVFNELSLREPGGLRVRVLEAATFAPPLELPARVALGAFQALSLPCPDLDIAREFWGKLGFGVGGSAAPWDGIAIDGAPLVYHDAADFREPALCFVADAATDTYAWQAAGMEVERVVASLRGRAQLWRGPARTAIAVMGWD